MQAVILAAGTGSRLSSLTRDLPKALVELRGRPLIDYTLRFVNSLHCDNVVVVGGFYFEKLSRFLQNSDTPITLLENKDYLQGNIFSLLKALPHVDGSFLLMNVDHVYPLRLGQVFLQRQRELSHVTAFVDFDRPLYADDMKVQLQESPLRVKRISKELTDYDAGYIGMTYVPGTKLRQYKAIAESVAAGNKKAVVENVLQELINTQEPVDLCPITGIRWLEVDDQGDLNNAERILKWVKNYLADDDPGVPESGPFAVVTQ